VAAEEGDRTDDPSHRATTEAGEGRPAGEGGARLPGAMEGRATLRLVGPVLSSGGAS